MKHKLEEQTLLLHPASARENSSAAQVHHAAPEPPERRDYQRLSRDNRANYMHTREDISPAFISEASRPPFSLSLRFSVRTIFQVKQTGLTDVLQLAARLAYFCFLETHTNARAPAEYCERPGTNLKDRKSTLISLPHSNEVTILVLAQKLKVQTHLISLNRKFNFFILMLRFRPQEIFVSLWCLTLTGESVRKVSFLVVVFLIYDNNPNAASRSTQRKKKFPFAPGDVSTELSERNGQSVTSTAASPGRLLVQKKTAALYRTLWNDASASAAHTV